MKQKIKKQDLVTEVALSLLKHGKVNYDLHAGLISDVIYRELM